MSYRIINWSVRQTVLFPAKKMVQIVLPHEAMSTMNIPFFVFFVVEKPIPINNEISVIHPSIAFKHKQFCYQSI